MGTRTTWRTCCPARLAPSLTVRVCGSPGNSCAARMGNEWVRSRPSSALTRNPGLFLVKGLAGTRCRVACSSSPTELARRFMGEKRSPRGRLWLTVTLGG